MIIRRAKNPSFEVTARGDTLRVMEQTLGAAKTKEVARLADQTARRLIRIIGGSTRVRKSLADEILLSIFRTSFSQGGRK